MPDEAVQELGREGVGKVRAWLEATTWFDLPFNAYEDGARCKVATYNGPKKFDLRGHFRGDKQQRRIVTVECKKYATPGGQRAEFDKFLAIAYSATLKTTRELQAPWREDFLWVTFHPFAQGKWPKLAHHSYFLNVLNRPEMAPYLGGEPIDEELAREVAGRIWLLVLNDRQLDLALTSDELLAVLRVLNREVNDLWKA